MDESVIRFDPKFMVRAMTVKGFTGFLEAAAIRRGVAALALGAMLGGFATASPGAQEVTGKPRVVDGDTLEFAGLALRLAGADAPPSGWICGPAGQRWRCGMEAAMALEFDVARHWVTCTPLPREVDGVTLARCKLGPYDLAARVVLSGWAMAVEDYTFEQEIARREGKGIWRGGYIPPPGWRAIRGIH